MEWRELGWLLAILAVFALECVPALISLAKEESKERPKDVI
jgi:hypothetical protein